VALSGGVDSAVVAKAAYLALNERSVAVTATSASLAEGELEHAQRVAQTIGIEHRVIATREFDNPDYVRNDGTRCYYCKSELYDRLAGLQAPLGFAVICSGANMDDLGDYRPGLKAASERGVRHPLQEVGFGKAMIRKLAAFWGLPNWSKPAAPCLASRIAVGLEVTPERTARVDRAERLLRELGLSGVRVRYHHDDLARIEVDAADLPRLTEPAIRERIVGALKRDGFKFVAIDLEGFRSGSLNVLVPAELLERPRH
jgi:uncharacterized protein